MRKTDVELELEAEKAECAALRNQLAMTEEALRLAQAGYLREILARVEYERTAGVLRNVRPDR